ncbi:MAG: serine/threonine-protein phosphatase [Methylococcaceae bacterium]|nr:serine/threonine-protein phosphatase [Methylococcaceae bacterium]
MQVQFYQLTSVGDRATNEDCMARIISDDYVLCMVADGLGGHQGGELASRYFCQSMLALAPQYHQSMQHAPQATIMAWVDNAVDEMQKLFADEVVANEAHTTCAILYLDEHQVVTAHCGDSRIYRLNADEVLWRTQDHSFLQKMFDRGEVTEQEMGSHSAQNKLTRSINVAKQQSVEVFTYPAAQKGETFVLCSDGFWGGIKSHEWLELAQPESDRQELAKLAQMVVLRAEGKSDNVTVQWLRCL